MAFLKHVGRQGDRKVAIVFREIPEEGHMALVVYTETLPAIYHDAVISTLESEAGQAADSLGDELFRQKLPDGRGILGVLHSDGMMKKVQTESITVTPNTQSSVRLDELNKLINETADGTEAAAKLAELDANAGLENYAPAVETDESIALARITESKELQEQARTLRDKAEALRQEAFVLDPSLKPKKRNRTPKTTVKANAKSKQTQ